MNRQIEPGLIYFFRYFTGVAVIYFAILAGYSIFTSDPGDSRQKLSLINLVINFFVFIYLSIPWLRKVLKNYYLPLALVIFTGGTVFSDFVYLFEPGINISTMVFNSWELVPILLIPLVLIAWQYSFRYVLLFIIFTNAIEECILLFLAKGVNYETLPILTMPFIRAFAFGVVGYIIERLVDIQRRQKDKLLLMNLHLGQYANTLDELATSRERNRLARELHDTLAHTLSGVAINLEAIKTLVLPEQKDVLKMLDHSLSTVRQGLNETRRSLHDLRAQPLEDLGLPLAIRTLTQTFSDREGIPVNDVIDTDFPVLPANVEQNLYRITQEALENIARHAQASQVVLSLRNFPDRVELLIRDNGCGFDMQAVNTNLHFGLRDMRERTAIMGAHLSLDSRPGKGTTIRCVWENGNDQDNHL